MKRATPRRPQLTQGEIDWLLDGENPDDLLYWLFDDTRGKLLWEAHRQWALKEFCRHNPGRRPWPWWKFEAPEPRRRLGGIGTPCHECLAVTPWYQYGLPTSFVSKFEALYYRGQAVTIHGEPIPYTNPRTGCPAEPGDFEGVPIDATDPPRFESEAAYLQRHGLLLPGEEQRLTAEDYAPDLIEPEKPAAPPEPLPRHGRGAAN
jgi:hypothetical protein